MITLREWFQEFTDATGETPVTIVFGWPRYMYGKDKWPATPEGLTPYADVNADLLDYPFDNGYGAACSPNLCAWSPTYVIFSDNYDGSEEPRWMPRDPTDHQPIRPGGG